MTIVFSGSPVANVQLSDSFNTWRLTTNKIMADAASLTSNNTFAGVSTFSGGVTGPVSVTGSLTATTFICDGSQLTNAGSTVATDSADHNLLVPFTGISSGTMTSANVNASFTFNPSTATLTTTRVISTTLESSTSVKAGAFIDGSNRTLIIRNAANSIVWGQ